MRTLLRTALAFVTFVAVLNLAAGVPVVQAGNRAPENGLVAYWGFEEGLGTVAADASGNGNNGTLTGGATWTSGAGGGNGLYFDGVDDYVIVDNSASLQFTSELTISVWVNFDGDYYHHHSSHLVSKGATLEDLYADYTLRVYDPDSTMDCIWYETADPSNVPHYLSVDNSVVAGAWHHLAAVYNAGTVTIYLDGQEIKSGTTYNPTRVSTQPLYIGHRYAAENNGRVKGKIDEVRLYDRALDPDEVYALYRDPGVVVPSITSIGIVTLIGLLILATILVWRRKAGIAVK